MKQSEGSSKAFSIALEELEKLDNFGRLGAFDYLEILIRTHRHDWIAPDQLQPSHIKTCGPKETFEDIYSTSVGDSTAQQYLDELQRWAQLEQGMSRVDAVFDIESCLCTYSTDLKKSRWPARGCL